MLSVTQKHPSLLISIILQDSTYFIFTYSSLSKWSTVRVQPTEFTSVLCMLFVPSSLTFVLQLSRGDREMVPFCSYLYSELRCCARLTSIAVTYVIINIRLHIVKHILYSLHMFRRLRHNPVGLKLAILHRSGGNGFFNQDRLQSSS